MKKPLSPPDLSSISVSTDRLLKILEAAWQYEQKNEYIHWDTLCRKPIPEWLDHKELWFGIKLTRLSRQKPIPLCDKVHVPFRFSFTDFLAQSLHQMDLDMGGKLRVPEVITNPGYQKDYLVRSLINEAITSSQLEGASTTRKVANEMLRSSRLPRDRNEQMIYNNYATMKRVVELKGKPLDVETILEIHLLVTEGTLDDETAAGRLRRTDERVVVEDIRTNDVLHDPPHADELPKRLKALCDFANAKTPEYFIHPVVRAIIVHFWLAYDHPFTDGNGRTARGLFYWTVLHNDYWLFEFISISEILVHAPTKYARSFLYTESDENDLTYFIDYQIKVIERSTRKLYEYIEKKSKEAQKFKAALSLAKDLNHRQNALLMHAFKHPYTQYSVQGHKNSHRIAYDTARHDLLNLEEKGLLEKSRRGNAFVFTLSKNFLSRRF